MNTLENYIESISKVISIKKDDTLINHIKTFLKFYGLNTCGNITNNEFKIWRRSRLIGAFYFIIKGTVIMQNDKPKVIVSTKMNTFGNYLKFLFLALFTYVFITIIYSSISSSWLVIGKTIILVLLVVAFAGICISLTFRYHKRNLVERFKNELETIANKS